MSTTPVRTLTVSDERLGIAILQSNSFATDHPFRSTRQVFGPTVVDTEGNVHAERKKAWLQQFTASEINKDSIQKPIYDATEEGFSYAIESGDLLLAAIYIPNKVLLALLGLDDADPMEHYRKLRPITDYIETNQRGPCLAEAKSYLSSGEFHGSACRLFSSLPHDQRTRELILFSYATAESTIVALKNLIIFWATSNHSFNEELGQSGPKDLITRMLRVDPPVGVATRYCRENVTLEGEQFNKGDIVHVDINEVNRKVERGTALTFGTGKHACPGHLLAKAEMECVIEMLSDMNAEDFSTEGQVDSVRPMTFRDPGTSIHVRPSANGG